MRLWSLHPMYLDRLGLCGLWREALLAQDVLKKGEYYECLECGQYKIYNHYNSFEGECLRCKRTGRIKTPYFNHSQLDRFKISENSVGFIGAYLANIHKESFLRGYNFKEEKIFRPLINKNLNVTTGQLEYEFWHLQKKLKSRDKIKFKKNINLYYMNNMFIKPNPVFRIVSGDIEPWEKIKK